jgi:hypothetical protein
MRSRSLISASTRQGSRIRVRLGSLIIRISPRAVGHIEGRQVARCREGATRSGGSATYCHGLSTCHPDGAPVLLEEDAATVTELLLVRLISECLEIVVGLLGGKEEE